MTKLRTLKLLLSGVTLLFVLAAVYISTLVVQRQEALRRVSRYNVAWLVSQGTTEFARLEQRISAFAIPGGMIDEDEVKLRFDIIVNRLNLLKGGEAKEFIASDPANQKVVADLASAIELSRPLLGRLDRPETVPQLLKTLGPLAAKLARLAATANRWGGDRVAEDQSQLLRLHWFFSALAGGLILCGIALIALLLRHNQLLQKAERDLLDLAANLRRASGELEQANQIVRDKNLELQGRNEVLTERDDTLRTQNQRFDAALNNMSQGLCMVDAAQRLIVCNQRYLQLFDLDAAKVTPGRPIGEVVAGRMVAARHDSALELVYQQEEMLVAERIAGAYLKELPDGRTISVSHEPMPDGGWVATYEDVTERRRVEARIAHMAHHDALTELPNRLRLKERTAQALLRLDRYGEQFAVLCLDLDRFKEVNNSLGHPVGDALLRAVAERLIGTTRETDLVARLGGDEFAILNLSLDQPRSADMLARRILEAIAAPYDLDGQQIVISTSIGIAVAPSDGISPDQLFKNADMALYRAKGEGRNVHRFFEAEMDVQVQARRRLETDLRQALQTGQFQLAYQPLVLLDSNRICGCEALLRWNHPERGSVSPAEFIPAAEEIGLILPLGEWVLRKACQEAAEWPADTFVAVNLSPIQFRSGNLVETVRQALALSGLPANRLELEITETALLTDNDTTIATLHELRGLGLRIALDDFGTGYSSLSYLRSFPFDKIKIDQGFVRDMPSRADCRAIVKSIAGLGRSLGMTTTAEGIETEEQLEEVIVAGCSAAQGYYFSVPLPAKRILATFAKDRNISVAA